MENTVTTELEAVRLARKHNKETWDNILAMAERFRLRDQEFKERIQTLEKAALPQG